MLEVFYHFEFSPCFQVLCSGNCEGEHSMNRGDESWCIATSMCSIGTRCRSMHSVLPALALAIEIVGNRGKSALDMPGLGHGIPLHGSRDCSKSKCTACNSRIEDFPLFSLKEFLYLRTFPVGTLRRPFKRPITTSFANGVGNFGKVISHLSPFRLKLSQSMRESIWVSTQIVARPGCTSSARN